MYFCSEGFLKWEHVHVFWYCWESRRKRDCYIKIVSDKKEEKENKSRTAIEYFSVEYPLNIYRSASHGEIVVAEIPNIINEENVLIAQWQEKISV